MNTEIADLLGSRIAGTLDELELPASVGERLAAARETALARARQVRAGLQAVPAEPARQLVLRCAARRADVRRVGARFSD